MSDQKHIQAAAELEELIPQIREAVRQLRSKEPRPYAYALVYELRRRLGYTVRPMGAGEPAAHHMAVARNILDEQINRQHRVF